MQKIDRDMTNAVIERFNEKMTIRKICTELSVSNPTVYKILRGSNIALRGDPRKLDNTVLDKIFKLYDLGYSEIKIGKLLGISKGTINKYVSNTDKIIKRKRVRYGINSSVFKKINTEEKAYWLGFLYADGYVRDKIRKNKAHEHLLRLKLQIIDIDHIKKFKSFLDSEHPIRFEKQSSGKCYPYVEINSKEMVNDLIRHGCVCNKSLVLKEPIIQDKLCRHFIRGYVDGDGWVSKKHLHCTKVGMLSTFELLSWVQNILYKKLGIRRTKIIKRGKIHILAYGSEESSKKIYRFLYKDATVFLERKKKKFNDVGIFKI
jgi:predicted transcriptional regulator